MHSSSRLVAAAAFTASMTRQMQSSSRTFFTAARSGMRLRNPRTSKNSIRANSTAEAAASTGRPSPRGSVLPYFVSFGVFGYCMYELWNMYSETPEPLKLSVAKALESKELQQQLGENMQAFWFWEGYVNQKAGKASIRCHVSGDKGSATVLAKAVLASNGWVLVNCEAHVHDTLSSPLRTFWKNAKQPDNSAAAMAALAGFSPVMKKAKEAKSGDATAVASSSSSSSSSGDAIFGQGVASVVDLLADRRVTEKEVLDDAAMVTTLSEKVSRVRADENLKKTMATAHSLMHHMPAAATTTTTTPAAPSAQNEQQ